MRAPGARQTVSIASDDIGARVTSSTIRGLKYGLLRGMNNHLQYKYDTVKEPKFVPAKGASTRGQFALDHAAVTVQSRCG